MFRTTSCREQQTLVRSPRPGRLPIATAVEPLWGMNTREMRSVAALFGSQDGLATITQLSERGVTPGLLRQRLASEEWGRIGRGVITVGSAPPSWRRSVRAAVLAAGPHSFASHATAARLHGFDGYQRANRIIISGVEGHHVRSIEGVEVHRSTVLDNEHRRLVAGISCAIEPVALIQIAATDGRDSAAQALDSYLRDGKSAEWVRFVATPLVRPKFGGPRIVLELLRKRVEARLPRSWFQRLAGRALASPVQPCLNRSEPARAGGFGPLPVVNNRSWFEAARSWIRCAGRRPRRRDRSAPHRPRPRCPPDGHEPGCPAVWGEAN